jgi:AraC-like DNA-binding protein
MLTVTRHARKMSEAAKSMRIPVITNDLPLSSLARLAVAEDVVVDFHPLYQGFRCRLDGFRDPAWRPPGEFHVLLLAQDGRVRLSVRRNAWSIEPGMAFLLRPDCLPAIHFEHGVRYHETYFRLRRGRRELRCAERLQVRHRAWVLAHSLDSLAGSLREAPPGWVSRHWLALALAQFQELVEHTKDGERGLTHPQREAAIRWAREHLDQSADPEGMARAAGLSHDYFTRLFRNTFGLPPRDWTAQEKIREACRLLVESSLRSQEIAHRLGYESSSSFGRQFRQITGISPARYRQQHQTKTA